MTFSRSGYDTQINLSSEDLFEISQEISQKFAPNPCSLLPDSDLLPHFFSSHYSEQESAEPQINSTLHSSHHSSIQLLSQEILEISQEISHQFAPCASTSSPELVLLPVDPYHLYAYWNLGELKDALKSKDEAYNPLILRIYWRPDENTDISNTKIWFDVVLDSFQSGQKVRLPIDGTAYSAVIGKPIQGNRLMVFADSNIIHVPCDKMKPAPTKHQLILCRESQSSVPMIPYHAKHSTLQHKEKSTNFNEVIHGDDFAVAEYEDGSPIAGIWYEKDFNNKPTYQEKNRENEIIFFSKLKNMRFENDIYGDPVPKTNASETVYFQNKNVSGQRQ